MRYSQPISRRHFCQVASAQIGMIGLAGAVGSAGCSASSEEISTILEDKSGLGFCASLGGRRLFPADNAWNQDISQEPVDPNSDVYIAGMGLDKRLHPDFGTTYQGELLGFPYVVVPGTQLRVPIRFVRDGDESDLGPYPVPLDAPVEAGSDGHVIVVDRDNWKLYEMIGARRDGDGWQANSGAIFDLRTNKLRPAGWTSANAAGLPVLAGLVRYDEVVEQKANLYDRSA